MVHLKADATGTEFMPSHTCTIRALAADDIALMDGMLTMFGEAFGEPDTYGRARPSPAYLRRLLGSETFIAIAAVQGDEVVGGLAAYELRKFEQERSEIYIYDLAVANACRRQGIATALIGKLVEIGRSRGAYVIFVQADHGDAPAIALYTKLGAREDVLHFDIQVA
jgi:aminoglycoside 3-N-acetyltransferase I